MRITRALKLDRPETAAHIAPIIPDPEEPGEPLDVFCKFLKQSDWIAAQGLLFRAWAPHIPWGMPACTRQEAMRLMLQHVMIAVFLDTTLRLCGGKHVVVLVSDRSTFNQRHLSTFRAAPDFLVLDPMADPKQSDVDMLIAYRMQFNLVDAAQLDEEQIEGFRLWQRTKKTESLHKQWLISGVERRKLDADEKHSTPFRFLVFDTTLMRFSASRVSEAPRTTSAAVCCSRSRNAHTLLLFAVCTQALTDDERNSDLAIFGVEELAQEDARRKAAAEAKAAEEAEEAEEDEEGEDAEEDAEEDDEETKSGVRLSFARLRVCESAAGLALTSNVAVCRCCVAQEDDDSSGAARKSKGGAAASASSKAAEAKRVAAAEAKRVAAAASRKATKVSCLPRDCATAATRAYADACRGLIREAVCCDTVQRKSTAADEEGDEEGEAAAHARSIAAKKAKTTSPSPKAKAKSKSKGNRH